MGTKGLFGFKGIEDRQDNLTEIFVYYSITDCYPTELGYQIMSQIQKQDFDKLELFVKNKIVINDRVTINKVKLHPLSYFWELFQQNQTISLDINKNFIKEIIKMVFLNWIYIVNFKTKELEIYSCGTINKNNHNKYFGCELFYKIHVEKIKKMTDNQIKTLCFILEYFHNFLQHANYPTTNKKQVVTNNIINKVLDKTIFLYEIFNNSNFNDNQIHYIKQMLINILYNNETRNNYLTDVNIIDQIEKSVQMLKINNHVDIFVYIMCIYILNKQKSIEQMENLIKSKFKVENVFRNFQSENKNVKDNISTKAFKF